ncbi:alpha/beta fold hydrolase [Nocardioides sp. ChNu-153]|uniref:alpha/beta hydrolase n=1 Tax=unclassified Nocardioides TaxID=2615069 RepID=UPI0024050D58|nr:MULTISPECIES: alpha/beta fold hydrolase [unclassified Nocardioides]MDF9716600.1 alpha/beta fold hydrolase [Nocardioides sp. ChNu-99]MDN7120533.1 alpha/beta fold hydrolase [Nocardioides sp. ChNu-153]
MAIHPLAHPFSAPARPDLTGGRRVGVLLSHGFTGSPASMRPWGEALAERGYAVEVPRLPGHGTTWQEMNRTGWADWHGHLERTLTTLADACDAVVVGGLSMGGGLVLSLAARHPEQVAGVVLVNPAVTTTNKQLKAVPVLQHLVPSVAGIGNDIAKPGADEHGYARTPLRALASMTRGWRTVQAELERVQAPVLLFRSRVDKVVDPSSGALIRARVPQVEERVLEHSFHVATLDHDAERIIEESAEFVARVTA